MSIDAIASFIAARLNYPQPGINGQGNPWTSTIAVDQSKSKFGYVRIYCNLAESGLVQQKWQWLKDRHRRREVNGERGYDRSWPGLDEMLVAHEDEAPEAFAARCMLHDAIHYRRVYMDMVELQPALREKICNQADYLQLLLKEFDESKLTDEQVGWQCVRYRANDRDGLISFMKKVYNPSYKDIMELRD